jgi:hypothetical protein
MRRTVDRAVPFGLAAAFTVVVQGLSLAEFLPVPMALLAGVVWTGVSAWPRPGSGGGRR